jgi:hypothetical protein
MRCWDLYERSKDETVFLTGPAEYGPFFSLHQTKETNLLTKRRVLNKAQFDDDDDIKNSVMTVKVEAFNRN